MNIIFLTLSKISLNSLEGIYGDLISTLSKQNQIVVVSPLERKFGNKTILEIKENIFLLKVSVGNITGNVNKIEKGITTFTIQNRFLKEISKHFSGVNFDLILYSTPPITFNKVVQKIKQNNDCVSYLLLKDIFPQNAVDLNIIKNNSLLHKYFRRTEKKLYSVSDFIGCMSNANKEYLLQFNPFIEERRVEIFPNSIIPSKDNARKLALDEYSSLTKEYKFDNSVLNLVYGGNIGIPQDLNYILEFIRALEDIEGVSFRIFGSGSHYNKLKEFEFKEAWRNTNVHEKVDPSIFKKLLVFCDAGMVFLDYRFTIPNYPSRITTYMDMELALIAATDEATDLRELIEENGLGFWTPSSQISDLISFVKKMALDKSYLVECGKRSKKYLNQNFNVVTHTEKILSKVFSKRFEGLSNV